jgi:hypothetical protein
MWTKIEYDKNAKLLLNRATDGGWFCVWASHDGRIIPDWWQRGKETRAAYSAGAEAWIDPDGKKIAKVSCDDA